MSEKEKMLQELLYDANNDKELIEERTKAKDLCHKYNNLLPSKYKERENLIKQIINTKGKFLIEQPFYCDYGYNITVGENFYANHGLIMLDGGKITIGNNVFLGPNCQIYTAHHPIDVETRNKGLEYVTSIEIGNNVWIGGNVTILPGVKIGNDTVIGAGSVVTKSIPDNVIAIGNPCKIIKHTKYKL